MELSDIGRLAFSSSLILSFDMLTDEIGDNRRKSVLARSVDPCAFSQFIYSGRGLKYL